MPLLNAAIVTHSPILIPEIGKINRNILTKTVEAYNELASQLQGNDIETIIIISPHGQIQDTRFTINVGPESVIDLSKFGYLGLSRKFTSDLQLIGEIKEFTEASIQLVSQEKLDYGCSVPLHLLTNNMPDVKIVTINYAGTLSLEQHFALGEHLAKVIANSAKRVALIASGDLSHRLKKNSPVGYSPKGAKFDNKLIEYLNNPETVQKNIFNMDAKLIKDATECGLKSIVVLLGALNKLVYKPKMLAYQTELGIGYLTMDFKL